MRLFMDDLKKCSDKELYGAIITAQEILVEKRLARKAKLEAEGILGVEYAAVTNELATLRKGLNVLKLFSASLE